MPKDDTLDVLAQARDALRTLNERYGPDSGANLGHDVEGEIGDCCDSFDNFRAALADAGEISDDDAIEEARRS